MIASLKRWIMVGDKIPILRLPVVEKGQISTKGVNELVSGNQIVLLGHPGAFTKFSTQQMIPDFAKAREMLGAPVYAFSVNDHFVIKRYMEKYEFDIPMICDFSGELTRLFDLELPASTYFSYCCKRAVVVLEEDTIMGVSTENDVQYTELTSPSTVKTILDNLR